MELFATCVSTSEYLSSNFIKRCANGVTDSLIPNDCSCLLKSDPFVASSKFPIDNFTLNSDNMPAAPKQRKIAIVGSRSVGKSSLTVRFVEHHFVESYYPTIENTFSRIIKCNGQDFATEIVDTAGQDEYSILNSKHFIGIHGYIIAYSVASRQSFDMVRVIRDKILNHLGADYVPLVVVGNKSDLKSEQRQVSLDEGRQLGEEFHCAYTEASARLGYNVEKTFDLMIGEIEKSQNPSQPTGGNKCAVM